MRRIQIQPAVTNRASIHKFMWNIVQLSPSVEEFIIFPADLTVPSDTLISPTSTPTLQLKALKLLRLAAPYSLINTVYTLSLPSLAQLVLEGLNFDERISSALPNVLKPFGKSVTHLVVFFHHQTRRESDIPISSIADMLQPMAYLKKFTISLQTNSQSSLLQVVLHTLLYLFEQQQGVIPPRLECLHIEADASVVLHYWELVCDFILACQQTYLLEARQFRVQVDVTQRSFNGDKRRWAEQALTTDKDIKACSSDAFRFGINKIEVVPM